MLPPPLELPNDRPFFERHRIAMAGFCLRALVDFLSLPRLFRRFSNKSVIRVDTGKTGSCRLCIYTPNSQAQAVSKPKGVLVHIHGGGWTISRPEAEARICRYLCKHLNVVVVAPDYRKAPRYPYPHALEQCYAVLSWIASGGLSRQLEKQGKCIKVDVTRIALSGSSAGSNLAASLTLLCIERPLPRGSLIVGLGLLYPAVNLALPYKEKLERVDPNKVLPPWMSRLFLTAYLPPPRSATDPYVSPALACATALAKFPSTIVMTAAYDYLAHEADEFASILLRMGVSVAHRRFSRVGHAFDGLPTRNRQQKMLNECARDEAWSMMVVAFRRALGSDDCVREIDAKRDEVLVDYIP